MKKILFILICFFASNVYANTSLEEVTFVRCVDGDTAVFNVDDKETKFRFLAIDTPETVHPTKEVEKYGKDASEYTCNALTNATKIEVEYENSNLTDKYGRSLAWIWIDGKLLQEELVDIGYAKVAYIYDDYKYTDSLCYKQKIALNEGIGLWNDTKDEGYCSTINVDSDDYNIDYNVKNEDDLIVNEAIEEISNKIDKITDTDVFNEKNSNIIMYIFMGCALIVCLYKEFKK